MMPFNKKTGEYFHCLVTRIPQNIDDLVYQERERLTVIENRKRAREKKHPIRVSLSDTAKRLILAGLRVRGNNI